MSAAIHFYQVVPDTPPPDWHMPLSLEVPEGSFTMLATTPSRSAALFRLCIGLRGAEFGQVEVLGVNPTRLDRHEAQVFRRMLGVALLPGGLISNLTLRMNLVVPLVYSGVAALDEATRRADEALDNCDLRRWANDRPADVPPDVRQRAAIARALVRAPRLLLLEDPLWAVNNAHAEGLLALCRRQARTVVVATHREDEMVAQYADRVASWDESGYRLLS